MPYSSDLYDLIRSLNQTEKRYVKLFAQAFSSKGTQNQLDLFDAFDQQQEYDEESIRKDFKNRISHKNFHVAKNRLYNLILKALYQYHATSSERVKVYQQLYQAEILKKKGLFEQAHALIEKSIQQAKKLEFLPELIHAYGRKIALVTYQRNISQSKALIESDWLERVQEYNEVCLEELNYVYLELRTLLLTHKVQVARHEDHLEEVQEIQQHVLLADDYEPATRRSAETYNFINAFLSRFAGNYQKACVYFEHFVLEFEEIPKPTKSDFYDHISNLNNLMFMQLEGQFYIAALLSCNQLRALRKHKLALNDEHILLRIDERVTEFQLQWFLACKQYKEGKAYLEKNQTELHRLLKEAGNFRRLVLNYNIVAIYLANGDFELADDYLQTVFENETVKEHEYIYSGAIILQLIIHYELGNYQLLESLLLNSYRMMSKRNLLYKSEKLLLKYLKNWIKMPSKTELKLSLQSFQEELKALQEENPSERFFLDQFDLLEWIESKLQDCSMVALLN